MQIRHWIGLVVAVVLVGGYFYWIHTGRGASPTASSTPPVSLTASSTGGSYQIATSSTEKLTVAGVTSTIVGSWQASGQPLSATFTAANQVTIVVRPANGGTSSTTSTGSWQLYTAANPPADLKGTVFESGGVFLRLNFSGQKPQDFFVSIADTNSLRIGPIGEPGTITFTRVK